MRGTSPGRPPVSGDTRDPAHDGTRGLSPGRRCPAEPAPGTSPSRPAAPGDTRAPAHDGIRGLSPGCHTALDAPLGGAVAEPSVLSLPA
ncbi:hypothetical protein ACIBW9_15255 [Streptomyces sp. NPDC049541]|uniref:hypothetical protein n=1 Tax=Streptomyces sp. NPDC049541 TaxID=3365594 RepID=UPI00379924D2